MKSSFGRFFKKNQGKSDGSEAASETSAVNPENLDQTVDAPPPSIVAAAFTPDEGTDSKVLRSSIRKDSLMSEIHSLLSDQDSKPVAPQSSGVEEQVEEPTSRHADPDAFFQTDQMPEHSHESAPIFFSEDDPLQMFDANPEAISTTSLLVDDDPLNEVADDLVAEEEALTAQQNRSEGAGMGALHRESGSFTAAKDMPDQFQPLPDPLPGEFLGAAFKGAGAPAGTESSRRSRRQTDPAASPERRPGKTPARGSAESAFSEPRVFAELPGSKGSPDIFDSRAARPRSSPSFDPAEQGPVGADEEQYQSLQTRIARILDRLNSSCGLTGSMIYTRDGLLISMGAMPTTVGAGLQALQLLKKTQEAGSLMRIDMPLQLHVYDSNQQHLAIYSLPPHPQSAVLMLWTQREIIESSYVKKALNEILPAITDWLRKHPSTSDPLA